MTGLKIGVEADVSGIQSELSKVEAAAKRINDTLASGQVGIDIAQAKRNLDQLEEAAKAVSDRLASASGAELDSVGKSAAEGLQAAAQAAADLEKVLAAVGQSSGTTGVVRNAKEQADHLYRAARAQEVLSREGVKLSRAQVEAAKASFDNWRRSGARGTSRLRDTEFDDWLAGGWRNHAIDQREAERRRAEVLRAVGIDAPDAGHASPFAALRGKGGALTGAAGGVLGGMLGSGDGGLWGAVGSAGGAGGGMLAGAAFGGPAGALVGAFLAQILGGLGRSLDAKLEQATGEAAIYTDLRRSVGVTSTEFDELRDSVRHFSAGLGLAYNESAALAKEFARVSNTAADEIGKEVGGAAGFARGFGADPAAAVRMMATMRHLGVTGTDVDSKRLALMIGEAVQRGGTTAKLDEVLSVLQTQASSQARSSLSAPEMGAMASFLSSLTGLSMYGIKGDPTAAGAAMSAADAAMRQGGGFGEASKNFSLGLWQRMLPGFTALDMDFMNEQGAFGNIGKAFGRESAAYKLAEARGDREKMAQYDQWVAAGGDRSVLAMQMQALEQYYGGSTDEFRKSIQSHFGGGAGQASALYQAYKKDRSLGDLERTLRDAGFSDINQMSEKQIAAVAEIAGAGKEGVRSQAGRLRDMTGADKLSTEDANALERALKRGNDDELRKVVIRLTAAYDSTRDQGEQARQTQAGMANAMQELATKLIPATLAIKDGITALVTKIAPDSEFAKRDKAEKAAVDEYRYSLRGRKGLFGEMIDDPGSAAMRSRREQAIEELRRAEAGGWISREGQRILDSERPSGEKGSTPRNLRNNNPGNIEFGEFAKRHGAVGSDGRFAIFPDKTSGTAAMDALLSSYSTRHGLDTVGGIIGKWAPSSENKTSKYASEVARRMGVGVDQRLDMSDPAVRAQLGREMSRYEGSADAYDAKIPGNLRANQAAGASAQPVSLNVGGRFELYDQSGRELAPPIIQTVIGAPRPAGGVG